MFLASILTKLENPAFIAKKKLKPQGGEFDKCEVFWGLRKWWEEGLSVGMKGCHLY